LSATRAHQTIYAAVFKSLSVNLLFCFIFMRHRITAQNFLPVWGVIRSSRFGK
jgi:ABC-type enterochelin transport system permease subunit